MHIVLCYMYVHVGFQKILDYDEITPFQTHSNKRRGKKRADSLGEWLIKSQSTWLTPPGSLLCSKDTRGYRPLWQAHFVFPAP